jgi:hypothetical protein
MKKRGMWKNIESVTKIKINRVNLTLCNNNNNDSILKISFIFYMSIKSILLRKTSKGIYMALS